MNIKTIPGNLYAIFGATSITVGMLNLVQDMWSRAPWFTVFCAVSAVYLFLRVVNFFSENEREWQRVAQANWERGYQSGKTNR